MTQYLQMSKTTLSLLSIWQRPGLKLIWGFVLLLWVQEFVVGQQNKETIVARPEAHPGFVPTQYQLAYEQHFDSPDSLSGFVMSDPRAWRFAAGSSSFSLEQFKQSDYKPPHRSPVNLAFIRDVAFEDFILEVDLMQNSREYGHRDMCLFFGFQNPSHFYYVHLSTAADDHAHNIFLVNDAPRTKIATHTTEGVDWGRDVWQKIRIERQVVGGDIRVFWNNTLVMESKDTTFGEGYIGFGSFDDTGKIDNIRIWTAKPPNTDRALEVFPRWDPASPSE